MRLFRAWGDWMGQQGGCPPTAVAPSASAGHGHDPGYGLADPHVNRPGCRPPACPLWRAWPGRIAGAARGPPTHRRCFSDRKAVVSPAGETLCGGARGTDIAWDRQRRPRGLLSPGDITSRIRTIPKGEGNEHTRYARRRQAPQAAMAGRWARRGEFDGS